MFPPRFAPILQEMEPLAALFREAGHRLFLVGGSVRDLFLGDNDAGTDLNLIDFDAVAGDLIPDPMSKLICPGHRRGKDVVNGFDLVVDSVKWRLIRGNFIVQSDGFNCGPIACLKVMELFSRLDESEAADCYAKARIRYVVFEEWHKMIKHLDEFGCLKVNDMREELPPPVNKDKADS